MVQASFESFLCFKKNCLKILVFYSSKLSERVGVNIDKNFAGVKSVGSLCVEKIR